MSQQKIVLALSLVASLVVLVSGQLSFDPNTCSQKLQSNFDQWRSEFTSTMSKCVDELSAHGQNAFDRETITKETSAIMNSFSSLMNSNGLDATKWTQAMSNNFNSYMKIVGVMANPSNGLGMWQTNVRCVTSTMTSYSSMMSKLPSGCVGGSKY